MAPVFNSPQVFPISCSRVRFVLSFFRSCHFYSLLSISLSFSTSLSLVSFSISLLYLSIRLSTSLPAPLRGCLLPEFIHASWWRGPHYLRWMDLRPFSSSWRFAPLLEILVARRVLILLPFLFFYFDHLLRFLKILFTRRAWELRGCCFEIMFHDQTYVRLHDQSFQIR